MKRSIKRLCMLLAISLLHEFAKPYQHYYSTAPDFVLNEIKQEPNYLSAVIVALAVWGLCELVFWIIAKIKQKKQD